MGIVFRQSIKTTIVTFSGALLGAAINYVYSLTLNKQDFGIIRNLLVQGSMVNLFVLMGVSELIAIYLPKYSTDDKRRKVLITISLIIPLIFTIVYTIPYVLFKQQIIHLYQVQDVSSVSSFYKWTPLLVLLMGYVTLFTCYMIAEVKVTVSAFSKEILLRLVNIVTIVLFLFKLISFRALVICNVLAYVVPIIFMFFIARRTKGFGFSNEWSLFSKKEYVQMAWFSWYHLLMGVSLNVLGYLDPIMLGAMSKEGLRALPVYSWALFIISVMVIPYRAMTFAAYSVLNRSVIEKDDAKLADLFHRSGINILIIGVAVFSLIACNTGNLVAILPPGYEALKPVVLILMIGRMVDMATGMNSELISFTEYYRFNFRAAIFLVVVLYFSCRFLIPVYGVYGAAWSSTIALVAFNIGKMLFLYWKMKLQPFTGKSLLILLAGLLTTMVGIYLPYVANPYLDTIIRSAVIMICYLVLLLIFKPSPDLTSYINHLKLNKKLY